MDWPNVETLPPPLMLCTFHLESMGLTVNAAANASPATVTNVANLAYYIPFVLTEPRTVVKLAYCTGTTASGNIDMGLYDEAFNFIVSLGATTQGTANTLVECNITDTLLPPGIYFVAFSASTTGTIFACGTGVNDEITVPQIPYYTQASAHPLPTSVATPVKNAQGAPAIPLLGVSFDTLI